LGFRFAKEASMTRRCALPAVLLLLTATSALAVTIDAELEALLAQKSAGEQVPILMIYDAPAGVADLADELKDLGPEQRRQRVVAALRKRAAKMQAGALAHLRERGRSGAIDAVQSLYLAGAVSFRADPAVVPSLTALPDAATLFYDKTYDLTRATSRGPVDKIIAAPAAVDTAWGVKYVRADQVWDSMGYTGQGVIVGHIDTGVWLTHPDLASRLWVNPGEIAGNGVDDDQNGFTDDIHGWDFGVGDNDPNDDSPNGGHGTHTAGTVVGDGSGGIATGVAPGAELMVLKVWQADGSGGSLGMIWAAEQYCVENGARIITMSLGIPGNIPESFLRAERANNANIRDAGVVFFNSAGNEHGAYSPPIELTLTARVPPPWLPGGQPHSSTGGVISVGGTYYRSDDVYNGSSRGPARWDDVSPWNDWPYAPGPGLIKPDLALPGVLVNSTVLPAGYSGNSWTGTSMACPHAAGIAALMLEKNPTLSPAGIDSIMEKNAIDLGAPGKDNDFGSGRPDALIVVAATPLTAAPDIAVADVLPDPFGDQALDPGQVSSLAFRLTNSSPLVAALAVSAILTVDPNPWVTVTDGSGSFPAMAAGGGTADNQASPFSLEVGAGAPQGFAFTMNLTVTSGLYFQQTFDVEWYVGLPDWRTHDVGEVFLTVTDQGTLGFLDDSGAEGAGMGLLTSGGDLFIGSFWAATGADYVCNRDYSGLGGENYEWIVSDTDPNGRVQDLGEQGSDQTFRSTFTDAGHAFPKPLSVELTSMAFDAAPDQRFVILDYRVTNHGTAALPSLYTGVYCDFDIGDGSAVDRGGTDASRNLTYLFEPLGLYYGIALLGAAEAANLSVVNNPQFVYPVSHVTDADKFGFLSGSLSFPAGKTADDWSAITAATMGLEPGGTGTVVYALVVGESLQELQANVDAANAAYNPVAALTEQTPVKVLRLEQNHPNPFNPATSIRYVVEQEGPVTLEIFDVAGRRVRTLVREVRAAGEHAATWNGTDDDGARVPGGMYIYRIAFGGQTAARKMMLLK
jgi:subtilisin family serine protease